MKLSGITVTLGAVFITACASAPPATSPAPASLPGGNPTLPTPATVPVVPPPTIPERHTRSWNFAYAPGTYVYSFRTDATVAPITDTTLKRPAPELNQRATITISAAGDVQVIDPATVTSAACDPNGALATRAQRLIPKIPNHLTVGDKWRDSTMTTGCRGPIPAESTVISNYVVVGDTVIGGSPLLRIQRTDSLSAAGEGADGQHRILISATGSGQADLHFDFSTGRLVSVYGVQNTLLNVTTSGRVTPFLQHVTESISIAGIP